jgi:hypothetical protein
MTTQGEYITVKQAFRIANPYGLFSNIASTSNIDLGPYFVSTVEGLGTIGYISTPGGGSQDPTTVLQSNLGSTIRGLGTFRYLSSYSTTVFQSNLGSTVQGLGTLGYLSSFGTQVSQGSLTSTVQGLGTLGYLSSFGTQVSQGSLTSTVQGLGTLGYLSSTSVAPRLGNTLTVDQIHGNDTTASPSGTPYQTINAAVNALLPGDSIWILPGNYGLSGPITIPNTTSIRGLSLQTVTIYMSNVTTNGTMITMGENTRLEDVNIKLHSAGNYNLTGIQFPGTTNMTAKIRNAVITVDNSSATSLVVSSDILGVHVNGTGNLGAQSFSYNCLKSLTINIYSNGLGRKRGILIDGVNSITSTRDVNVYVQQPPNTNSAGSYVGVETSNATSKIQLRTTNIGGPLQQGSYTSSDILQTLGSIELGPGTDLVTKTAGTSSFISYVYPTEIYYGVKGLLNTANLATTWLWPGTGNVQAQGGGGQAAYPDSNVEYYRIQQNAILFGMTTYLTLAPGIIASGALQGKGCSTLVTLQKNGSDIPFFTGYGGTQAGVIQLSTTSISFLTGDFLSVKLSLSTLTSNLSHDLSVQLSMF